MVFNDLHVFDSNSSAWTTLKDAAQGLCSIFGELLL